ncbi:MAG: complex I NDUFA9 subunit family protein [Candidatus Aenigmatarchaeota archaeon]
MKIFVAGGTGFLGSHLLPLIAKDHEVYALVRSERSAERIKGIGVQPVMGDLKLPGSWVEIIGRMDVVVNLVGIIREGKDFTFNEIHYECTRNLVLSSKGSSVKKFIQISALGTRRDARSMYHKTKWMGEEAIRESGIPYVIFRPSVICGPGDKLTEMLVKMIRLSPVIPVIGSGEYRLQPIFVKDLVKCIHQAIERKDLNFRVFEIAGPEAITFNSMLDILCRVMGVKRLKVHIPLVLMKTVAFVFERVLSNPPITTDQILMLEEENICDIKEVQEIFSLEFCPYEEALRTFVPSMVSSGT